MTALLRNTLSRSRMVALTFVAVSALIPSAYASTVNIVNGSFSTTGNNTSSEFGTSYPGQTVNGWATSGYNFVFTSPGASALASPGNSPVSLYNVTTSPDGGNFLALNGVYLTGAITQTLTGLVVGDTVDISFWYAGAQQVGYNGATTDALIVSLGSESHETPILNNVNHGFTGWNQETLSFTATSTSEVLSFLAVGTPSGEPPFTLLDGVSATQTSPVPEPSSLLLLATGLTGLGGMVRACFSKRNADKSDSDNA